MQSFFLERSLIFLIIFSIGCNLHNVTIMTVSGPKLPDNESIWLTHEHILVDFIGADSIKPESWNHKEIIEDISPYLLEIKSHGVEYFIDATPNYLGRDPDLLRHISDSFNIEILTTTGIYGARGNKYFPDELKSLSPEKLAEIWINEFENGIGDSGIKPGFIKIGVDAADPLDTLHVKLVKAAAKTHLETGLTIASHTGPSIGLWPQLQILKEEGVSPKAFIWVHAQQESDTANYLKAAESGCWISLDGLGWVSTPDEYIEKLKFAKENGFLDQILISHDAGWYDPQKIVQDIKPYTFIFEYLYPSLISEGFSEKEWDVLVKTNPKKAFGVQIRLNH